MVELSDDEEIQVGQQTLQVLATIVPRLSAEGRNELLPKIAPKIAQLALHSQEMPVRTLASTFHRMVDEQELTPLIFELAKSEPNAIFPQLGLQIGFMRLRGHETAFKLREELPKELSEAKSAGVRRNILLLIDGMRTIGWAM